MATKPTPSLKKHPSLDRPDLAPPPKPPSEEEIAVIVTQPETLGAMTIKAWTAPPDGEIMGLDHSAAMKVLKATSQAVVDGDMSHLERTAAVQAMALDSVFNILMTQAREQIGNPSFEMLMRMAFRAQSQCTRTLETLAAIKNPAIITRQLNMANQQVVNYSSITKPALPSAAMPPTLPEPAAQPIVRIAQQQKSPHAHERMD